MSRRWLVVGVAAVAGAVAAAVLGAWWFLLRDVAEPATVNEAVSAFRQHGEGGRSTIPPGVYVYATTGSEHIDALGGVTHRYPRTSTITVTGAPCGVRLRWDVLVGRSTTWTVCTGASAWVERGTYERHTFFGTTDVTRYACTDTPFRPAGDRPGTAFGVACSTGKATERGTGRVVGRETIRVGGANVPAVHVRTTTSIAGDTTGTGTSDFWLARDTGLPVRIEMVSRTTNGSLIGDVHYEEQVSLRLTSLVPRR